MAHGQIQLDESKAEEILAALPPELLWEGAAELDNLVLALLADHERLTGRELARVCGTIDRTIRRSVSRLRVAGHKITGSMGLPYGYRLET